jgi:putative PIN family toxin of toxin-antitoxin system
LKVVLDTNIYISAILFGGRCEEILKLAAQRLFHLIVSRQILDEIKSVLKEKFKWTDRQAAEVIKYIKEIASVVNSDISLHVITKDRSDNKIIECAVASGSDYIVTGDKSHLLSLKEYEGIKIMSPAEFLRL